MLQAKFHMVAVPSCLLSTVKLDFLLRCCFILHNMIVNERRSPNKSEEDYAVNMNIGADFAFCFEPENGGSVSLLGTIAGSVAAISSVSQNLSNA